MKIRIVLLATAVTLALGAFAPSANALTRKLFITPEMGQVGYCRAATDQVQFSYTFKAKIKRKNAALPKRVNVKYSVTDMNSGAVVVSQRLTLKPRKYYKVGALTQYQTLGQQLQITADVSARSTINGRMLRSHSVLYDTLPTVEQMDLAATPLPACAVG